MNGHGLRPHNNNFIIIFYSKVRTIYYDGNLNLNKKIDLSDVNLI